MGVIIIVILLVITVIVIVMLVLEKRKVRRNGGNTNGLTINNAGCTGEVMITSLVPRPSSPSILLMINFRERKKEQMLSMSALL